MELPVSAGLKTPAELALMRQAGLITAGALDAVCEAAAPGATLKQLDRVAFDYIADHGATPNFLGYYDYPATFCISVNDTVVHGIPDDTVLRDGDLVSFDGGCLIRQDGREWHSDSARSLIVGDASQAPRKRRELNEVTRASMWAGIAAFASAKRIGQVGAAIEDYLLERSADLDWPVGIVEGYTGHGIGTHLHEEPDVPNYRVRSRGPKIKPGLAVCIEPMVTVGDPATRELSDGWTVKTVSGQDAAHWEHTVAMTHSGQVAVLTAADGGVAELADFGVEPFRFE